MNRIKSLAMAIVMVASMGAVATSAAPPALAHGNCTLRAPDPGMVTSWTIGAFASFSCGQTHNYYHLHLALDHKLRSCTSSTFKGCWSTCQFNIYLSLSECSSSTQQGGHQITDRVHVDCHKDWDYRVRADAYTQGTINGAWTHSAHKTSHTLHFPCGATPSIPMGYPLHTQTVVFG